MHWLRSSLKNFLQAADVKEVDDRDVKELFENVSNGVNMCTCMCTRVSMFVCVHAYVRTCVRICMCTCVHLCVCTRMCVHAYVCAEVVTYIQITNVQLVTFDCSFVFYTTACIHIRTCIY